MPVITQLLKFISTYWIQSLTFKPTRHHGNEHGRLLYIYGYFYVVFIFLFLVLHISVSCSRLTFSFERFFSFPCTYSGASAFRRLFSTNVSVTWWRFPRLTLNCSVSGRVRPRPRWYPRSVRSSTVTSSSCTAGNITPILLWY